MSLYIRIDKFTTQGLDNLAHLKRHPELIYKVFGKHVLDSFHIPNELELKISENIDDLQFTIQDNPTIIVNNKKVEITSCLFSFDSEEKK